MNAFQLAATDFKPGRSTTCERSNMHHTIVGRRVGVSASAFARKNLAAYSGCYCVLKDTGHDAPC